MKSPSSEEKGKGIMLINHCRSLSFSDRFFRVAFRFPLFLPLRIRKKSITVYDEGFIRLSSDFLFFLWNILFWKCVQSTPPYIKCSTAAHILWGKPVWMFPSPFFFSWGHYRQWLRRRIWFGSGKRRKEGNRSMFGRRWEWGDAGSEGRREC